MSGMRIRWETAGKVIAGVAAVLVIIGLAPSLLAPRDPEPLPEDVGLAPPPPVLAPIPATPRAKASARAAARRKAAERRRARLEAKRAASRRRQNRKHRPERRRDESPSAGWDATPVAVMPAYPPPPPPPTAAGEFGFER
jgi:hypothetical protein